MTDRIVFHHGDSYRETPRWPRGGPPHPELAALIARGEPAYRHLLAAFERLAPGLARIPAQADPAGPEPWWANPALPPLDGITIYGLLALANPAVYCEVGSGNSTKFARRAIADHRLRTRIVSIDPQPAVQIDALCDTVIRSRLEDCDLAVFRQLAPGDVLFVDNSHRGFMNSDVTVCFLEIMPRLRPGVVFGLHDIFLPWDYPEAWRGWHFNEQYYLAALLLGGMAGFEPLLAAMYVSFIGGYEELLAPFWRLPPLRGSPPDIRHGGGFWLRKT